MCQKFILKTIKKFLKAIKIKAMISTQLKPYAHKRAGLNKEFILKILKFDFDFVLRDL